MDKQNEKSTERKGKINLNSTFPKPSNHSRSKSKPKKETSPIKEVAKELTQKQKSSNLMEAGNIRSQDFEKELDGKMNELAGKRQRMYACIDLFNLMQSNNMQVRCLQHNNVLTLYCLTERRVLCVNCTYGVTKHRTHKVLPLRDSGKYISEDNELLRGILNTDLRCLEDSIKNSQQNTYILERELKKSLQLLEFDYRRKIDELTAKLQADTNHVKRCYSNLFDKSKKIQAALEEFKFKIWQTLSKIGIGKGQANSNQIDIIRQVFCVNLSQLTHVEIKRITKKQIQKLTHKAKG